MRYMPFQHILLALLVVVVWGINFIFVTLALEEMAPLLLCAIRFILASIPAILFIPVPAVPFRIVVAYGLIMFGLQFSLLFMGMHMGMPPGLTSLVMQVQVFFSMFFAALVVKETPNRWQILGALISFAGIAVVAVHFDQNASFLGLILVLGAAATWGAGNLITKKTNNINMIALVVWSSFIVSGPMLLLSLCFEGTRSIVFTYEHLTWRGTAALLYIVYISTWVGYGVWNWLLGRYPVSTVAPFTLLVPIVGVVSSMVFLAEPFAYWKLTAGLLVIAGLCINIVGTRYLLAKVKPKNYLQSSEA